MKVACLIDSASRKAGGLFTSVRRLMQETATGDCECRVFAQRDEFTEIDLPSWSPLPLSISSSIGPRRFGFAPELGRSLRMFSPDLVQVHGLWTYTSWIAQRWHHRSGGPCFVHPHGMLDPWAVRHSGWKKRVAAMLFEERHLREAGCLRALCEAEADAIRAYGIRAPVATLPNAVDLPVGVPAPSSADAKMLLYLGRIHPKKGLPLLVAAKAARKWPEDWQLAVAGWDEQGHEEQLMEQCRGLGIPCRRTGVAEYLAELSGRGPDPSPRVSFLGAVYGEEKEALFRASKACVLPSFSEGLPMSVLEAWSHRLPVLMTDHCNLPEGFARGAALRIETEVASIACGLDELFAMTDRERRAMGEAGRRLVEERFAWPQVATQMREVHEWLLGGGPVPACVER